MILNQAALKRQATVLALLVIIVIAGVYCYATLPRESFPDITIPYVFVTTTYEGVAPEDMEQLITIPIERKLKGAGHVSVSRCVLPGGPGIPAHPGLATRSEDLGGGRGRVHSRPGAVLVGFATESPFGRRAAAGVSRRQDRPGVLARSVAVHRTRGRRP